MFAGKPQQIEATVWSSSLPSFVSPSLAEWLGYDGLLTPRMRLRKPDGFRLSVGAEYHRALDAEEKALLSVAEGEAQVRNISMGDRNEILVIAASIIPVGTLAEIPELGRLGDRALGEVLAGRKDIERGPFQYAVFEPRAPDYPTLPSEIPRERLFARRSVIRVGSAPILVLEYFRDGLAADASTRA